MNSGIALARGDVRVLGLCAFIFASFAALAVAAPLASYTLALALFGLPHILSEMRYVDRRFGRRIERPNLIAILTVLAMVILIRVATVAGLLTPEIGVPAELAGVAALALIASAGMPRACRWLALGVAGALGVATIAAPFGTATSLAVMHNLTPLGFLWQLAPPARRARLIALASIPLLIVPLLVATGLPRILAGGGDFVGDPLAAGPLAAHLYVYVPALLLDTHHALDLFSASVVAQGAHYLAVIVVLPLLLNRVDPASKGLLKWPSTAGFVMLCAAAGAISLAVFAQGFVEARALYGIAASLHAWIEIPVLVLALSGALQDRSNSPAASEAALASSET